MHWIANTRGRPAVGAAFVLALAAAVLPSSGCARKAPDSSPEGAVRDLLEHAARAEGDPSEARVLYELLSARARANLTERARRASAAHGRELHPEEMLAPGRFSLRFQPVRMHTRQSSGRAVVDVFGVDPESDHAEVPCVLEQGHWHIEIPLPPVLPLEHRPEP